MSGMEAKDARICLEEHGVSPTPNRVLVVRELSASSSPLSLSELEQRLDTLDKSSISRVLTLLADLDIVHALEDGRGITKYELCHSADDESDDDLHCHFYCIRCRRTYCLPDAKIPEVEVPQGFRIHGANFMLKGVCADCVRHVKD